MSDDAIRNAVAKRADLEAKIAKSEELIRRSRAQIAEINRFIKQWEKFSGRSADDVSHSNKENQKLNSVDSDISESPNNPKKEIVAAAVVEILAKAGRPVSRADLFKALQDEGLIIYGAHPEMVLSTMLWRTRDDFGIIRLKSGGYTLAELLQSHDDVESEGDGSDLA